MGIQDILDRYPAVKPADLELNTGPKQGLLFIHVKHRPTGKERLAQGVKPDRYQETLRRLLTELLTEVTLPAR